MGRRILRKPVRREPVRRVKHKRNSQVGQRKMKRVVKSLPKCPLNPVNRTRKSGRLNNMRRKAREIKRLSAGREANDGQRQERRSTIDTLLSKRRSKRPVHKLNNTIFGRDNSVTGFQDRRESFSNVTTTLRKDPGRSWHDEFRTTSNGSDIMKGR